MAVAESSLNSHRIRLARITIPRIGTWLADVWTDDEIDEAELLQPLSLHVASSTLVGALIRGESWQGSTRLRLVGGRGGWRMRLPARWYTSDAGVRASRVAADAAQECGEILVPDLASDPPLGAWYMRQAWSASRTLSQLGLPWHITDDGLTSLTAWGSSRIGSQADVVAYDAARCIIEVATDTPGDWRPGRTFADPRLPDATYTISDVVLTMEPGKLRAQAWCTR